MPILSRGIVLKLSTNQSAGTLLNMHKLRRSSNFIWRVMRIYANFLQKR